MSFTGSKWKSPLTITSPTLTILLISKVAITAQSRYDVKGTVSNKQI